MDDDSMHAVNCADCGREVKGRPGKVPVTRINGRPFCQECARPKDQCWDLDYGRTPAQLAKIRQMLGER